MPKKRKPPSSGGSVLKLVGVAALAVVAAGLSYYALTKDSTPDLRAVAADYQPPTLPEASAGAATEPAQASVSPEPSDTATAAPSSPAATDGKPRVVFLGDSYAASDGASDAGHGFPALVAAKEGWDASVVACDGAGYLTAGSCGKDYSALIPDVVAADPSIVVVSGGRYDSPSYQTSKQPIDAFFTALTAALPGVQLVVVSPVWDASQGQHPLGVVQQYVKESATAHGATYLDVGEPLRGHPELVGADGVLPNDDGYAALAKAIEGKLPKQ